MCFLSKMPHHLPGCLCCSALWEPPAAFLPWAWLCQHHWYHRQRWWHGGSGVMSNKNNAMVSGYTIWLFDRNGKWPFLIGKPSIDRQFSITMLNNLRVIIKPLLPGKLQFPKSQGWEEVEPLSLARSGCAAAVTGGHLYVVGGFARATANVLTTWGSGWNVKNDRFTKK